MQSVGMFLRWSGSGAGVERWRAEVGGGEMANAVDHAQRAGRGVLPREMPQLPVQPTPGVSRCRLRDYGGRHPARRGTGGAAGGRYVAAAAVRHQPGRHSECGRCRVCDLSDAQSGDAKRRRNC